VKNKGFTLIELMIAMGIIALIIGLSAGTFKTLLHGANKEKSTTETELGKLTGLELIRLDLEHVGFGINSGEPSLPVEWNSLTRTLKLRSMINNTNQKTLGWALVDVTAGTTPAFLDDRRFDTSVNDLVLLTQHRQFISNLTTQSPVPGGDYFSYNAPPTCPASACRDVNTPAVTGVAANRYIAAAFPFDRSITDGCEPPLGAGTVNTGQYCNLISYQLSTNQPLNKCAPGTKNLVRSVGGGSGTRVLECVADFDLRFDYDTNNDGDISDSGEADQQALALASTASIIQDLKNIDMYLLVQAGPQDNAYTFSGDITLNGAITTLDFNPSTPAIDPPTTAQSHYRWKVLKVSAKPMSW